MFVDANEPLALLVAVHPKVAKQLFRQKIYEAWENSCAYCGSPANSLDHVIPKFRGGKTVRSNLVPACKCNHHKGSENWIEWFQRQEFWNQERQDQIQAWMKEDLTNLQWSELRKLVDDKDTDSLDRMDDILAA